MEQNIHHDKVFRLQGVKTTLYAPVLSETLNLIIQPTTGHVAIDPLYEEFTRLGVRTIANNPNMATRLTKLPKPKWGTFNPRLYAEALGLTQFPHPPLWDAQSIYDTTCVPVLGSPGLFMPYVLLSVVRSHKPDCWDDVFRLFSGQNYKTLYLEECEKNRELTKIINLLQKENNA